ncbi:hypothetical protein [Mesorhizobium sp. M0037]|uniref:hypothetical protein n=1 Tax=unclassified Mesorhizobium TaxID=325217 RepID=UPI0033384B6D
MSPTRAQIERWRKLARTAAGIPEEKTLGELAREHLKKAVTQLAELSNECPLPDIRLKASTALVELARLDADDAFQGDPEAVEALLEQPVEGRRAAALQLFANGSITKKDLDVVLGVINGDQAAQINLLLTQNQRLEKALTDQAGKIIDGRVSGPKRELTGLSVATRDGEAA